MKKLVEKLSEKWYLWFICALFFLQAVVFLVFRENSYLQVHDNLDLFMAHYRMIKLNGGFFAGADTMPMLHGVSRDLLGSEFLLYNFLYEILPGIWAYLLGYAFKIAIGTFGFILLARDIFKDDYVKYKPLIFVTCAAYGMIPVFPTYGIAFTSVPLIIWLLRRLYLSDSFKKRIVLYLGVFFYPLISYFSYHGFFILCYMVVAVFILWAKDKKFPRTIFFSIVILSLGYMLIEYRLFRSMLFDDTVTIRQTMEHGELTFFQALEAAFSEFVRASFHSEDSHTYVVLPVCLIGLIIINIRLLKDKRVTNKRKALLTEPVNLIFLWMVFNVLIFGFYQYAPFRMFVERLIPKLTGFEFARTAYFNTFLWYALLLLVMTKLYDSASAKKKKLAGVIVSLAAIVVMFAPAVYNDFYNTCYNYAYKIIKQKETSTVNYREFYSEELFSKIKSELNYNNEWSAAYGMHPAILNYNGIASVDGYLGMYPQAYKDKWQKVIEPISAGSPYLKAYFDGWGARAYLYSGSDENTYAPLRQMTLSDNRFMANTDELKSLDVKYIFSRIEFSNADECNLSQVNSFSGCNSPYTIYVYEIK